MAKSKHTQFDALEPRVSGMGINSRAIEFLKVAQAANTASPHSATFPIIYNIELSMELAMKAFLRTQGATLADLGNFGHNLAKLAAACGQADMQTKCGWFFSSDHHALFEWLGELGREHRLRYFVSDVHRLPEPYCYSLDSVGMMIERAKELIDAVELACYEAYKRSRASD